MTLPLDTLILQAPRYISMEEACARLGIDEDRLFAMIQAGKVRVAVVDQRVMVEENSLPQTHPTVQEDSRADRLPSYLPLPQAAEQLCIPGDCFRLVGERKGVVAGARGRGR